MKTKNLRIVLLSIIMLVVLFPNKTFAGNSKKQIAQLNNSIIFDLFFNYELSEKNTNVSNVFDFCPNIPNANCKSIELTSNAGGRNQTCKFIFNDNGSLQKVNYTVNNTLYRYDFVYTGNNLTSIKITDKPKIYFEYNKKGQLIKIIRENSRGSSEYNIDYLKGENKANINLVVVQGERKRPDKTPYFVIWDKNFRLYQYYFDVFSSKNMIYSENGAIISYEFDNVKSSSNPEKWEYLEFDNNSNWTSRESNKVKDKRIIEYR